MTLRGPDCGLLILLPEVLAGPLIQADVVPLLVLKQCRQPATA